MTSKENVIAATDILSFYREYIPGIAQNGHKRYSKSFNCLFHSDQNPSASIDITSGHYKCFGCGKSLSIFDFLIEIDPSVSTFKEALNHIANLSSISLSKRRATPKPKSKLKPFSHPQTGEPCEGAYRYDDEKWRPLSFCLTFPENETHMADAEGYVRPDLTSTIREVPYRLPSILTGETIVVVNNEQTADRAAEANIPATTKMSNWHNSFGYIEEFFSKHNVVVVNSEPTIANAFSINFSGNEKWLKTITLDSNLDNWLDEGHTTKEFWDLVDQAPPSKPVKNEKPHDQKSTNLQDQAEAEHYAQKPPIPESISYVTLHELSQEQHEDVPIIQDFAHEEDITMIHAEGGAGKTTIIQNMLVTAGSYIPPLTPQDRNLLWGKFEIKMECLSIIIQSEMSRRFASIRMQKMIEGNPHLKKGAENVIMPLIDDNVSITGQSIDDPAFLLWVTNLINKIEQDRQRKVHFVAFDPLISFHDRDENSSELRRALDKLRKVCETTNTILIFSHHDNKNEKTYRGTTAIWDFCRNSIHIEPAKIGDMPVLKFVNNKCNHRQPFKTFHLQRDENLNFELITNTDALSNKQAERCYSIQNIFDELQAPIMTLKELSNAYQDKTGSTPSTAKRHIAEAEKHRFIIKITNPDSQDSRKKYLYQKNSMQP